MNFGSDEFYSFINQYIMDPSREDLYIEIAKVVEKDAKEILYKKGLLHSASIKPDDIADIIQEIQLSVRRSLVSFLKNSEGKSPSQRNAWLATIINRRVNDYFRVYYRTLNKQSLYSEYEKLATTDDELFDSFHSAADFNLILRLIDYICKINTTPEKIIAFLYNKILIALCCGERLNGFPEQIAAELNGQTLSRTASIIKDKLSLILSKEIPESVFEGLFEKLDDVTDGEANGERPFDMTPRVITDSSHWISKKLKKNKDYILRRENDEPPYYI